MAKRCVSRSWILCVDTSGCVQYFREEQCKHSDKSRCQWLTVRADCRRRGDRVVSKDCGGHKPVLLETSKGVCLHFTMCGTNFLCITETLGWLW